MRRRDRAPAFVEISRGSPGERIHDLHEKNPPAWMVPAKRTSFPVFDPRNLTPAVRELIERAEEIRNRYADDVYLRIARQSTQKSSPPPHDTQCRTRYEAASKKA
jgi:hypothetical protein